MLKSQLNEYKQLLLKKREEVLHSATVKKVAVEDVESTRKGDWIDQSSEDNDIYINIRLRQTDSKVLRAIDEALARIEDGSFGNCAACRQPMPPARLKAVPWARVCVRCKEKQES
jgi:DnaK suppressor protein